MAEEPVACMLSSKRRANEDDDSDSSSSLDDSNNYTDNKAQEQEVVDIKSLTVKFNNRQEIWRSPPTYGTTLSLDSNDNDAFVWPEGWIEVLKYQSVSRSPRQQVSMCFIVLSCVNSRRMC